MINEIIQANENAYINRYGISLRMLWGQLSEYERMRTLDEFDRYLVTAPWIGLNYEEEHLLRIVIGYTCKSGLISIFAESLPAMQALLWEPCEELFLAGCVKEDIHEFIEDDRIVMCIGSGDGILDEALRSCMHVSNAFHAKIMAVGYYRKAGNAVVETFLGAYRCVSELVLGEGNSRKFFDNHPCRNWINAISILNTNHTIDQLFNSINTRDVPVIIVAAGPSLEKNCKELNKAKGRAIIIAVSHAMKTLDKAGIVPDIVATADANEWNFLDFDKDRRYKLLCSIYASARDQNAYNGKVIFYGFPMLAKLFSVKRVNSDIETEMDTGSVATNVFSLFMAAGFKTLILVGQDLAYDREGYTHSGKEKDSIDERIEAEGIDGNKVFTRSDWKYFKEFIQKKITEYDNTSIIDATEGGARIYGTKIMTLSNAINKYCLDEYPVYEWIDQLTHGDEDEKKSIDVWFDECISDCEMFIRKLDRALQLNKMIMERWNNKESWDESFSAMCRQYDIMYDIIINGDGGFVLKHYCIGEIQRYMENALIYEGDDNAGKRLGLERKLFESIKINGYELITYIKDIKNARKGQTYA